MPPRLRGKVGLSYFLAALYTGKHTAAKRIMFNDLVCEEFRQFYLGIAHEVNGKKYYIQARLVMHILDTKAAEPVMGYQSQANFNFGCSNCGGVTGIHIGNQCVFLGNRNYLPQLNVLRFYGQTGTCCPSGIYNHEYKRQWYVDEHFHHLDNGGAFAMNDHYQNGKKHYQNGNNSKIVHHNISKVRVPKEKNRQQVRGAIKGTKAKEDEENKEDDCENEESGHAYKESDEEDEVDPFSIEKKMRF
jgi:hypothetical protein